MRSIEKILQEIENIISNHLDYNGLENEHLELKDLSSSENWKELCKTVCAFLNSNGGIIIIGVKEDNKTKQLKFVGYNSNNEPKIKELPFQFTNKKKNNIELSNYIRPDLIEIHPLCNGQVCVLYIENLPEDEKYVYYNGNAYERHLTGDHIISQERIKKHAELCEELQYSKEIEVITEASINDLDVDKLNDYIIRLNADKKIESLKSNIQSAVQFLEWKRMLRENKPTILGMLVCGKRNPLEYYLGERCELDAYFEMGGRNILAEDRKVYKENIIDLMESAWSFSFSKIGTGISIAGGGSDIFEYPEEIIRETINNALAHRDYSQNRFSIIVIKNNEHIEIRNPGQFRQEQVFIAENPLKIRRIIPIPKARNPNLADILKVYKRWEGRGIGMSSLVNYALSNEIDIPYYIIHNQYEISLYIQKGKVLDDKCEMWLNSFNKYIAGKTNGISLTTEQKTVLAYIFKSEELNKEEKYTINFSRSNNHFDIISELESFGLIYQFPKDKISNIDDYSVNFGLQLYRIDETLKKENHNEKLKQIFGSSLFRLNLECVDILNAIYQHNEYSVITDVSARLIGSYLYYKGNFPKDDRIFDNYKRKIRGLINKLEKGHFIKKRGDKKPDYIINTDYNKYSQGSLFDYF
jgi:predicted HTH transcriptional regulator